MIFYIFVVLIIGIIMFIYLKIVRPQKNLYDTFRNQSIPGEPFVPIFGQLPAMIEAGKQDKGVEYFNQLTEKHGYHFILSIGSLTRLVVLEPELLSDVLGRLKAENYEKTSYLINVVEPFIGVHNLLVSKHDEHERARKMLNPAFHFVNLQSMIPIMSNETAKSIDYLLSISSSTDQIRLDTELSALTLAIIASSAFGQSFETIPHAKEIICKEFSEAKEIVEYRTRYMINQVKFINQLPFWGKNILDKIVNKLDEFVNQSIADRRNGKSKSLCSGEDILDLLLSAVDDQGQTFSDQQIKDEALTFVLAGHETTGNLLTWALYILMTHDDVLEACRQEVDRILPNGLIPTFEYVADLQVIEAVLYETLRLYPAAPIFARQCIKEHTISSSDGKIEIRIPVNAVIVIHTYILHRREKYWPRPLKFDYKRWMRDPVTGLKPKLAHPYAYLPFAAGSRNCIGQNFALLEAKVILAMFVQRCEFQLIQGQKIVPEMKGVTMPPKYGIFIKLKERNI